MEILESILLSPWRAQTDLALLPSITVLILHLDTATEYSVSGVALQGPTTVSDNYSYSYQPNLHTLKKTN